MLKRITRIGAILIFTFTVLMIVQEIQHPSSPIMVIPYAVAVLWMTATAYLRSK